MPPPHAVAGLAFLSERPGVPDSDPPASGQSAPRPDFNIAPRLSAGSLRIGIMHSSAVLEAWQAEAIRRVAAVDGVTIAALIHVCNPAGADRARAGSDGGGRKQRRSGERLREKAPIPGRDTRGFRPRSLVWRIYRALSARIHQRWAQAPVEFPEFLVETPEISCLTEIRAGDSEYFADRDLESIRQLGLDAMLYFGCGRLRGEIHDIAQHGIWSFDHLHPQAFPGCPVGFWDVYHDRSWTEVVLRRIADRHSDEAILYRRLFRTDRYSCTVNAQHVLWRSVDWPAAVCRRLLFVADGGVDEEVSPAETPNHTPRAPQTCIHVARTIQRLAQKQYRDVFIAARGSKDRWALGVIDRPIEALINPGSQPTARWIEAPPGGFIADPFAAQTKGKTFIFCEHWDDESRKGHIAVIESSDLRAFGKPYPVIEASFHLSYPFVLQHSGDWFCVPEQHQHDDIALYRAVDFPGFWEQCEVLVAGFPGIDPTICQVEGQWWMFASCAGNEMGAAESSLYAFHSNSLHGPWAPHRSNPVIERRGRSRPAGRLFWSEGRLVRPVQECVQAYGDAILFYEITALSHTEYAERLIGRWERSDEWRYPSGMHHIERLGDDRCETISRAATSSRRRDRRETRVSRKGCPI